VSTTDTERADHLHVLGLSDDEIKVYQHLLRTGPSSITELGEAVPDRERSIDATRAPSWTASPSSGCSRRTSKAVSLRKCSSVSRIDSSMLLVRKIARAISRIVDPSGGFRSLTARSPRPEV